MARRVLRLSGLILAISALSSVTFAAESAPRLESSAAQQAPAAAQSGVSRAVGAETASTDQPGDQDLLPLGRIETSSVSPGKLIGDTWYDYQQNGSMGRMIDWGWDDTNNVLVHFTWMRQSTYPSSGRNVVYNCYYSVRDTLLGHVYVNNAGGYSNLDAAVDNRAVIAAHADNGSGYTSCVYWDFAPGLGFFGSVCCVTDSVIAAGTGQPAEDSLKSVIWPKFRYHDVPGQEPVTHVVAQVSEPGAGDAQAVMYFRKVGADETGDWDYPPYVFDTVFDIAQDVTCSQIDGKMALVWIANLPDPGDCDTCSSNTGWPFVQSDNDIYYQISYDRGVTFAPRVNLTKNVDGEEGYRPYTDVSCLIGSDNNLRIAWNGRYWPADANSGGAAGQLRCRMFYWGENLGVGGFDGGRDAIIRTAANLEWDQLYCNGGAWQLNGSKMSLSECDGKLYYLWVQFNDIPNGVEDDCAERAFGSSPDVVGAANGELYLAVSDDGGYTWDYPRNLTNTYTPHCDSVTGAGGRCQSEHWPSMAPLGTNHVLSGSEYVVIDPSDGYTGDYFLDVMYIDDADPGGIVQDEGTWQQADVMWFRLPCVEPVPAACVTPSVLFLNDYTFHGVEKSLPLTIENNCNADASFTVSIIEETGPEGWLTTSGFESGFLPAGDGILDGTIIMNTGGIVDDPQHYVKLQGAVVFEGDFVGSPTGVGVACWVIPPEAPYWLDTVSTGCLSLIVNANGDFGCQGAGKVNMDFFNYGDCDDLEGPDDTIPGDATVYLYDGSPVICWPDGDSVLCNYSIFGEGFWSDHGFLAQSREPVVDSGDFYYYQSEFVTRDYGVGVQQSWFAPKDQPDSCKFLIHRLQVSSNDGQTHSGLTIGEAVDWDIPSDTSSRNNSGFDVSHRLVYQQGSEYNQDDAECQENSDRFGGLALLQIVEVVDADTSASTDFYGAYTEDNATWVYPTGGFVPQELDSLMEYNEGYVLEADSLNADIHSVMTYRRDYTVTANKSLTVYSCLASHRLGYGSFIAAVDGCHQWFRDHLRWAPPTCCMGPIRGNVDYDQDDQININDLVCLVDWMFFENCWQQCYAESNVDGSGPVSGYQDGPADIDISDLVHLVDYMFTGGPLPAPCP